jgi:hypothetical protein
MACGRPLSVWMGRMKELIKSICAFLQKSFQLSAFLSASLVIVVVAFFFLTILLI